MTTQTHAPFGSTRGFAVLCVAIAVASSVGPAGKARSAARELAAGSPVEVDSFGIWSLRRLGVTVPIIVDPAAADPSAEIQFGFPPGARQGPSGWYLGHLHATVKVGAAPPGAVAYLDASVNGWEWAQIRLRILRTARGTVTLWDCPSILGGAHGRSPGTTAHIAFDNFLTIGAVRPGISTLSFALERYHGAVLRTVVIGTSTALEYSRRGPARLSVELDTPRVVQRGTTFLTDIRIANIGDRPVRRMRLDWDISSSAVTTTHVPSLSHPDLAPHRATRAQAWFNANERGVARLSLFVGGLGANGIASTSVRVH